MTCAREKSAYGKGSDFYDENARFCQPCSVNGATILADNFCVNCQDYLCQKCSTHHKALNVTQNHSLISIEEAKKMLPAAPKDKCSRECSTHEDKTVKYFCENHLFLGCSVCVTMDHKQCKNVDYIPTVAADIRNNDGFRKFRESLHSLEDVFKASIADVEEKIKAVETDELQLKDAIDEFRQQLIDVLDKLETALTRKANCIKTEETKKLSVLSTKLSMPMAEVNDLTKQLDMLLSNGNNCDAYVLMKKEAKQLDSIKKQFIDVAKDQSFKRLKFQPNTDALRVGALGTVGSLTGKCCLSFFYTFDTTCT